MAESPVRQAQTNAVSPWLIAVSVMLATFMEVLDTAIVAVALPYIAGSLSSTTSEATWVLTSYLIANAVILPASNWFALRFGRKRFLVTCVLIFTAASFCCGAAPMITLNVNGKPRRVDVMKQETLAWTLRYKLGLTGTKLGCDRAECGACTVLLDDVPHYSCSVLTHTVRGRKVTTIEGLAAGGRQAASGAAGGGGRAGIPVRLLHVGLHHVGGRVSEDESQSHARGAGARRLRQSVPVPGLQQDSRLDDARRRVHENGAALLAAWQGGPEHAWT